MLGDYVYTPSMNLVLNGYIKQIGILTGAQANKPGIGNGDTKDTDVDRIATGWTLVGKVDTKI